MHLESAYNCEYRGFKTPVYTPPRKIRPPTPICLRPRTQGVTVSRWCSRQIPRQSWVWPAVHGVCTSHSLSPLSKLTPSIFDWPEPQGQGYRNIPGESVGIIFSDTVCASSSPTRRTPSVRHPNPHLERICSRIIYA